MELPDAIDHIRLAIVQVRIDSPEAGINTPLGTGFLINTEAHVITAKHVIDGARAIASQLVGQTAYLAVGVALASTEQMRGNFSVTGAELVDEDSVHDLALLRLERNPFTGEMNPGIRIGDEEVILPVGTVKLDTLRPRDGQAVAVSGYPLAEPTLMSNAGFIASSWSTRVTQVELESAPPGLTIPQIDDIYVADVNANPGNSGGPIYSIDDGTVLGVCIAGKGSPVWAKGGEPAILLGQQLFYGARLTLVTSARYVAELLTKNGVSFT